MSKKSKSTTDKERVNRQRRTMLQGTLAGTAGAAAVGLLGSAPAAAEQASKPLAVPRSTAAKSHAKTSAPSAKGRRTVKGYVSPLHAIEFDVEDD